MAPPEIDPKPRVNLAVLAGEILQDVEKLVEQRIALAKLQFFEDWGNFKPFALWFGLGLAALSSAGLLFSLTMVFVIHESSGLPLWACFGITLVIFLLAGLVCLRVARGKAKELSFVNE